ncbi:prepilin-type N-terminal cleavage/methylation domain-containing protein [Candidatus Falkowbacteria bacterium]|nr:prepilin-type N-terminal cleavage/methylation domain-containing protein [Candidatus Falkowbacteria bacterium]
MKYNNKQNGFSLVELLIVILVILVLATISALAVNSQKAKARDAKRISDIRAIQTALEFYKSDEGQYPIYEQTLILGKDVTKLCSKAEGSFVSASTVCSAETTYMAEIPADPLSGNIYLYYGSADTFDISFTTEKPSVLGAAGNYYAHPGDIDIFPSGQK